MKPTIEKRLEAAELAAGRARDNHVMIVFIPETFTASEADLFSAVMDSFRLELKMIIHITSPKDPNETRPDRPLKELIEEFLAENPPGSFCTSNKTTTLRKKLEAEYAKK